jgi:DNA-binding response OmpR family regulator
MTKNKILYVEDEKNIRDTMSDIFELQGFDIDLASNGREALKILNSCKPDIIISDIMMPEMDGFEFIKGLKMNKETELIPLIFVTAKILNTEKLKGLGLGADDYITKPFEFQELLLKIKNILNTRRKLLSKFYTEPDNIVVQSQDDLFLKELNQIIEEKISDPDLSLKEIAGLMNYSESTLQRKLKKCTGKPVSRFIREYRLNRAKALILLDYGTISEITRKTGFSSIHYFSQTYKNFFHIAPSKEKSL